MKKAKRFEDSLSNLEHVIRITSPISQPHLINTPTGLLSFPLIHVDDQQVLANDSIRIFTNPVYRNSFGTDGKSLLIHINHFHFKDQPSSQVLLDQITNLTTHFGLENVRLVGKLVAQNEFVGLIKKDFGKFLFGSVILSLTLLLLIFRNLKTSSIPFLISLFSLVWLFGLIGFLEMKINLLSSLLPPIIFFSSMSDAVHLLNAIYKSKKSTFSERLAESVSIVWIPTFLTSFTTAIGFLSLLLINTEPIQILGVFAACGVLIAFIVTFTFGLFATSFIPINAERKVIQVPAFLLKSLLKNKFKFLAAGSVVIIILVPGISKLKVDAYLLDDLPSDSQVRQNFEYSDKYLEGSKPYEIRIDAKDDLEIWDKEVMDEIRKIEEYLINEYPIARVQSPSTLVKYLNQVNKGGLNENYIYPDKVSDYKRAVHLVNRIKPEQLEYIVTEDKSAGRIFGFLQEYGSHETTVRNEKMLAFLEENIDHSKIEYRITGTTFLIDKSHELLSKNLLKGLFIAILIIGTVLGIYFRSLKLLLISLIPNILPLLIVAGVLGWAGISLKMTTAIIFTIAFGIAVDDTIHMMSYYLKNKFQDGKESLSATFFHAGSAMLITSIIMIAGFSLFLLSEFGATFYLGLFVSLSLLVALLIDLTILPILLLSFNKKDVEKR